MKLLKNATNCGHCNRNTLLPYEYEVTCVSCGYNVIKRKHQLSKIQRKKIINRLKYAELKIFCICVDVYKIYEGDDYDNVTIMKKFVFFSKSSKAALEYRMNHTDHNSSGE